MKLLPYFLLEGEKEMQKSSDKIAIIFLIGDRCKSLLIRNVVIFLISASFV